MSDRRGGSWVSLRAIFELCTSAVLMVVAVIVGWVALENRQAGTTRAHADQARPEAPLPSEPLSLTGVPVRGRQEARVGLAIFSDFECPFCAKFATETLSQLERAYVEPGKVLLAFFHLPLEKRHKQARKAAEASECASRQGKFWEMHEQLFQNPRQLDGVSLSRTAAGIGLNMGLFDKCLRAGEASARLEADLALAKSLAVSGTPAFVFGQLQPNGALKATLRMTGAKPLAEFQKAIEQVLLSVK